MGITLLPSRRKKVSNLLPTRLSESYIYIYTIYASFEHPEAEGGL